MKTFLLLLLLLTGRAFACGAEQSDTNLAAAVLREAKFQDVEQAKARLQDALQRAALIIGAIVVNSNTVVKASPKQTEVSSDQGWRAASVQVTHVLKGDRQKDMVFVENTFHRSGKLGLDWRCPIEATNGQTCVLILEKSESLSRWCRTNVYRVMDGMEIR